MLWEKDAQTVVTFKKTRKLTRGFKCRNRGNQRLNKPKGRKKLGGDWVWGS